jgi:Ca2+-binding EF-hand superfamily protein
MMMNKLLLAFAMAAITGAAVADETATKMAPTPAAVAERTSFEKLDVNKDGSLSKTEAAADAWMKDKFDAADKNADGTIDASEYAAVSK